MKDLETVKLEALYDFPQIQARKEVCVRFLSKLSRKEVRLKELEKVKNPHTRVRNELKRQHWCLSENRTRDCSFRWQTPYPYATTNAILP